MPIETLHRVMVSFLPLDTVQQHSTPQRTESCFRDVLLILKDILWVCLRKLFPTLLVCWFLYEVFAKPFGGIHFPLKLFHVTPSEGIRNALSDSPVYCAIRIMTTLSLFTAICVLSLRLSVWCQLLGNSPSHIELWVLEGTTEGGCLRPCFALTFWDHLPFTLRFPGWCKLKHTTMFKLSKRRQT